MTTKIWFIRLLSGMIALLLWGSQKQNLLCDAAAFELHITCSPENFLEMRTLPFYPPYHGIFAHRRHFLCAGTPVTSEEMQTYMTDKLPSVETIGKVQDRYVERCEKMLSLLPESLRYLFVDYGWHFYVTTEDIAITKFNGEYASVKGLTDMQYLYIKVEDRDNATSTTILHEFGHFLDYCCNFPSEKNQFLSVMELETELAEGMGMDYGLENNEEYFAESFLWYMTEPETMKAHIPLTYDFICHCLLETAHEVHQ